MTGKQKGRMLKNQEETVLLSSHQGVSQPRLRLSFVTQTLYYCYHLRPRFQLVMGHVPLTWLMR